MLLAVVVETSTTVGATRSRKAKIDALAQLLRACSTVELPIAVCLLTGEPRQGRVGVGWSTVAAARADAEPSADPKVTVGELDATIDRVAATTGAGSAGERRAMLGRLFARYHGVRGRFRRAPPHR